MSVYWTLAPGIEGIPTHGRRQARSWRQHEVALTRAFGRGAQAVAEFELGLEDVGLQPGHRLWVEAMLTKGVRGRAGEGDVWPEVAVQGVRGLPA